MKTLFIIIVCMIIITVLIVVAVSRYNKYVNENNYKSLVRFNKELPDVDISKIDLPIFYINMDKHIDRKEYMTKQLVGVKKVIRVPGVLINDEISSKYIFTLSKPELGCFLAHIKALQEFLHSHFEKALILEDDACFKLSSLWNQRLSELDDSIFFLGFGASAYLVTKERAKFIVDKFKESNNIRFPIDIWYQNIFNKDKKVNRKDLIYQYNISLPSTISSNHNYYCINEAVKIIKKWI